MPQIFFPSQGLSGVLVFIPLFYFALNAEGKVGYITVALLGAAADGLEGRIIGVNLFSLLFFQTASAYQMIYILDKSFAITWLAFSLTALAALIIKWSLFALVADSMISVLTFGAAALKLIAVYPIFYFIANRIYAPRGRMQA